MDRFFPSAMTPPCRKFPAVTHEFDVCQKNLPVLIKKKINELSSEENAFPMNQTIWNQFSAESGSLFPSPFSVTVLYPQ